MCITVRSAGPGLEALRQADLLERRDRESQDRKRSRQGADEEMDISNKVTTQKWQNKLKVVQMQETW